MVSLHDLVKIEKRLEWLEQWFYQPIKDIGLQIAQTDIYHNYDEISNSYYEPIERNQPWGEPWSSAWFRGEFEVDSQLVSLLEQNHRLLLQIETGGESLVYLNRQPIGAIDRKHKEIILQNKELSIGYHEIHIQSYAGHNIPGYEPKPAKLAAYNWRQPVYKHCRLVKRNQAAWQLYFDIAVLFYTAKELPEDSLRRIRILKKLVDVIDGITWETCEYENRNNQFKQASEKLASLLSLKNSVTTPLINLIGHSHIDIAWLWPIKETIRKCGRTFATQLRLLNEYPFYKFIQSQAQAYAFVEQYYPELFLQICDAVKQGKWEVNGGMWVESDTNIPSAESLIRQFLIGQSFFSTHFGKETSTLWLPDVFGYSGNLPQIMKGCGIKSFITSKIGWNDTNQFPYDLFRWRGIDGSEVLTLFIKNTYNSDTKPTSLWQNWREFICKESTDTILDSVGYGDGGGGITMEQLEYADRVQDLEGLPKTRFGFVRDLMNELEQRIDQYPVYFGELYMENHRGTYTTQAWTKRNNRKIEFLIREAEFYAASASLFVSDYKYPHQELNLLWQKILTAQFHDILPGSSINRVYVDCDQMYSQVAEKLDQIIVEALAQINSAYKDSTEMPSKMPEKQELNVLIYNSLNWDRHDRVSIYFHNTNLHAKRISDYTISQLTLDPKQDYLVFDEHGEPIPTQMLDDRLIFLPKKLPQLGTSGFTIISKVDSDKLWSFYESQPSHGVEGVLESGYGFLENQFLNIKINRYGQLISIYDKQAKREILTEQPANQLLIAEDFPNNYDAWNIDRSYRDKAQVVYGNEQISLVASGPLEARIRVKRDLGSNSTFIQDIVLGSESRRIDFETKINWREKHRILKVSFPVNIYSTQAHYDIPGGYLARSTHRNTSWEKAQFEVPGHKWVDLSEPGYGVSLLNDCKYGYELVDNDIRLTLLKSPLAPDPSADQDIQVFTYSLYPHLGNLVEAGIPQRGFELNTEPRVFDIKQIESQKGMESWIVVESDQIWLQAVKQAEDNTGLILRFVELMGKHQAVTIRFKIKIETVWYTNMLEQQPEKISDKNADYSCKIEFTPFEIKTVKVAFKK